MVVFSRSFVCRVTPACWNNKTALALALKEKEKKRKEKERKGKERKGKERKGKERKGKERKGKERMEIRQGIWGVLALLWSHTLTILALRWEVWEFKVRLTCITMYF
jgi:hypothetical protein